LKSSSWLALPSVFALWTSIPVLIFVFILTFSAKTIWKIFGNVSKIEKIVRYIVAGIFIVVWVYYLQYTVQFIYNLI
jgi:heme/copper-type cytochrome/quinol oxidase subunit 2